MANDDQFTIDVDSIRDAAHRRQHRAHGNAEDLTITSQDAANAAGILATRLGGSPFAISASDISAARQRLSQVMTEQQSVPTPVDGLQVCSWCGNTIHPTNDSLGPSRICEGCGLAQHSRCWDDGGGCAQVGCRFQATV